MKLQDVHHEFTRTKNDNTYINTIACKMTDSVFSRCVLDLYYGELYRIIKSGLAIQVWEQMKHGDKIILPRNFSWLPRNFSWNSWKKQQ